MMATATLHQAQPGSFLSSKRANVPSSLRTSALNVPRLGGRRLTCRAEKDDKGSTATDSSPTQVEQAIMGGDQRLNGALSELPADQQRALSQLYLLLVQNSTHGHNIRLQSWQDVQRAIAEDYQVLVWRPAELLNGRMAMIGFVLGALTQLRTGQTVWAQLNSAPFAYLAAYGMVVLASLANEQFGRPKEGISIGPIKFSRFAELVNARAAMVGYALLMYIGYNTELQRAALVFMQRVQQGQLPGINA